MSRPQTPPEQLLYSKLLNWGSRSGLAISVLAFAAYLTGLMPAHVPLEELPNLWQLPSHEYLERTHSPTGWAWMSLLAEGDFASLFGIAWLSSCTVVCLLAIIPTYIARKDRIFVAICVLEIAVLALAASGILSAGH
jgi:hypothetical protein